MKTKYICKEEDIKVHALYFFGPKFHLKLKHLGNWGNWLSWSVDCVIYKQSVVVDVVDAAIQTPWVLRSSKWIERPPGQDLGGHRFESCRGLRFFVPPTLVRCLSSHFQISFTELKIYHLSFFQSCNVFSSIKSVQCSLITFVSQF